MGVIGEDKNVFVDVLDFIGEEIELMILKQEIFMLEEDSVMSVFWGDEIVIVDHVEELLEV